MIKYSAYDLVEHLATIYITHAWHFVKCFTNQMLHFDITITSRDESGHTILKRQLRSSGDLKTVVDGINLLLMNEYQNHLIRLEEDKIRYPLDLRRPVFQQITPFVTILVIKKILLIISY